MKREDRLARYAKIVEMREKDGMTFQQIADALGMTRARVHQLYGDALESNKPNSRKVKATIASVPKARTRKCRF